MQRHRPKAERALGKKAQLGTRATTIFPCGKHQGRHLEKGQRSTRGKSSGNFHRKGVALLNSHYAFQWDLQSVSSQIQVDGASDLPEAAQVKSLKMVSELEEFCDNEENIIFERSFPAAILFCTWECMCLQQT